MKRKWMRSAAFVCSIVISSLLVNTNLSATELNSFEVKHQESSNHYDLWVGSDGEVSVIEEGMISNGISVYCAHNLISGEVVIHNDKSGGGCSVTVYDADKCTKCGTVFVNAYKYTAEYKVCIH